MPPLHSFQRFSSQLSQRTVAPFRYSVLLSCDDTPTSAPTTSSTFTYSALHLREVALLRFALAGICTRTNTPYRHFFHPSNVPDSGQPRKNPVVASLAMAASIFLAELRLAELRLA